MGGGRWCAVARARPPTANAAGEHESKMVRSNLCSLFEDRRSMVIDYFGPRGHARWAVGWWQTL